MVSVLVVCITVIIVVTEFLAFSYITQYTGKRKDIKPKKIIPSFIGVPSVQEKDGDVPLGAKANVDIDKPLGTQTW